MNAPTTRRAGRSSRTMGAVLLGGALLIAPVTAVSAAPAPALAANACEVTGGSLQWGVKESFRAYISGTIANGEWKTSDGAGYEIPEFTWGDPTGSIDPSTGTGSVSFTGTVRFTGHEGLLDLSMSNPTIEFEGDGKASLMLDTKGTNAQGEVAVDAEQEWVGDVTAPAALPVSGDKLQLDEMPTKLSSPGAKAFAGFYQAGDDLDPVSVSLEFANCDAPAPAEPSGEPTEPSAQANPGQEAAQDEGVPWLPIGIGAVALVVIAVTATLLITGRKKPVNAAPAQTEAEQAPPTE